MPNFDDLISSLNSSERKRVQEYIKAIRLPLKEWINPKSDLVGKEFAEEFRSRIGFQHSFQSGPIHTKSFDAAFISAVKSQGMEISEADPGQRFWDVEVDGRKISLKSTYAQGISPKKLHISKLSEAAWI